MIVVACCRPDADEADDGMKNNEEENGEYANTDATGVNIQSIRPSSDMTAMEFEGLDACLEGFKECKVETSRDEATDVD